MKSKEFEAWFSRNVGKGGKRPSYDPFNKSFKGSERNPAAEEYASKNVEEYHRYPEIKDTRTENDDRQNEKSQSNNKNRAKKSNTQAAQKSLSRISNIIGRVVMLSAGMVVLANTNPAVAQMFPFLNFTPEKEVIIPLEPSWIWSDDNQNVMLQLLDGDGNVVKEFSADVTVSETPATCNVDGEKVYSASVEDEDGKTYSDSKSEVVSATGHVPDEGHVIILEDGTIRVEHECTHCHDKFIVDISVEED